MRKYLAVLLLIGSFFIIEGYSQEETTVTQEVYQEVYYRKGGGDGYFSDIHTAVEAVAPEGTVYIEGPLELTKRIVIQKSMDIKFLGEGAISIEPNRSVFYLYPPSNIQKFSVEGMRLRGTNIKGITGWAREITVKNGRFQSCSPINFSDAREFYRIDFIDCEFIDLALEADTSSIKSALHLYNNRFSPTAKGSIGIALGNNEVHATHNTFHSTTLMLKKAGTVSGTFQNNVFTGGTGTITIAGNAENLMFRGNSFLKEMQGAIRNATEIPVDFKRNWWGERKGPRVGMIEGVLNTVDWALFEDFSRFSEDPYTLEDLREACARILEIWRWDSWLYDMNEDEKIDLLDIVAMARKI